MINEIHRTIAATSIDMHPIAEFHNACSRGSVDFMVAWSGDSRNS